MCKAYISLMRNYMTFMERRGMYTYLDIHHAISSALAISREFLSQNSKGTATLLNIHQVISAFV